MNFEKLFTWLQIIVLMTLSSCTSRVAKVSYDFDKINNRVWIGEDFWTVPLEEWKISNGRIESIGTGQQSTCTVLPYLLGNSESPFLLKVEMGLLKMGAVEGSSGMIIGSLAPEEDDYKAAIYFGRGINAGINTSGYLFIEQNIKKLPEGFDFSSFILEITGEKGSEGYIIRLRLINADDIPVAEVSFKPEKPVTGIIQLVNNIRNASSGNNGPQFWFDNLVLEGDALSYKPENRFGPVLWAMHTLSLNTMKLTAQMPPVGPNDNQEVELQLKNGSQWVTAGKQTIEPDSRTATFRIQDWNSFEDKDYRILYPFADIFGKSEVYEYSGMIRKDPVGKPLGMGAMTCQYHTGFPYSPLVETLKLKKPDILYFSGDQIYEINGGYQIKREPEDLAILNYLGKWYMFGWAFGEVMRNIPTICTPDDHDVFQGNLWGGGGLPKDKTMANSDDVMGFTQTVKMVNVVNKTQCAHLPDPYDPEPIEQGMIVWYTSLNYGRVSFAIVSDRVFKSGPDLVSNWEGRKDHIKVPLKDMSIIDKPGLELLGKRQEYFLEKWIMDWKDVDMKVLLSQTPFANSATHHGQSDYYLCGDMDSGGWPKKPRDKAVSIIRKGFVFHISGDQHLPSITQYGIDDFRDAGWSFCTPAIAVGYSRWFRPDELNIPVQNRPEHNLPNTGEYIDAFGNLNYVYAIGNPGNFNGIKDRYQYHKEKTAGMGYVIFDKETRDIKMESWRFISNVLNPDETSQHPGWPKTINQMDNYGRKAVAWLPDIKIEGDPDPVVEIINQTTGDLEYIVRINGDHYSPKVFTRDRYIIKVGYPENDNYKEFDNLLPFDRKGLDSIIVRFK